MIFVSVAVAGRAMAGDVYFALGDSVAEGFQPTDIAAGVPTNGDRGYVSMVADRIGQLQGSRPSVVDLAIVGETSGSFFDTTNPYYYANTNYPPLGTARTQSQDQLFTSLLGSHVGAGDTVSHVSISLGANDLLDLVEDPTFLGADPLTQQARLSSTLNTVGANYVTALSQIRTALPQAQVLMPGFYNPYPAGTTLSPLGDLAVSALNTVIQNEATAFGGTYVDFFTPIEGHQATLTWIASSYQDIHPNDAGYAALGAAASAKVQAVPEPASCAVLGMGALVLLRRRKNRLG